MLLVTEVVVSGTQCNDSMDLFPIIKDNNYNYRDSIILNALKLVDANLNTMVFFYKRNNPVTVQYF